MAKQKKETEETEVKETSQKRFEVWRVEPQFKYKFNEETGQRDRILSDIKKIEKKRETSIEQKHADTLNSQVENSNTYYFPIEK